MVSRQMQQWAASGSAIRAMFEEGKRMRTERGADAVFDFSLGNPCFPAPKQVRDAMSDILQNTDPLTLHGYMNNSGFPEVRAAIAAQLQRNFGVAYTADDIVMTVGAAGGLNVLLKSILDPDDEVIVFAPYFGEYARYIQNYGGKLVVCQTKAPHFEPTVDDLQKCVTPRTKAIIVNSPNNPTGVVYSEKCVQNLCDFLRKLREKGQQICTISDEPYRELVYDGVQVTSFASLYPDTVVCYSYSKSLSLPGERIGYLALHPDCTDKALLRDACNVATRVMGFVNAPSLQQLAIAKCLDIPAPVQEYDNNRRAMCAVLDDVGLEYVPPQGAFYLWVRTPDADDVAFCNFAKQFGLLLVPGSGFGCSGWMRIAYCVAPDTIARSQQAFRACMEQWKQLHE